MGVTLTSLKDYAADGVCDCFERVLRSKMCAANVCWCAQYWLVHCRMRYPLLIHCQNTLSAESQVLPQLLHRDERSGSAGGHLIQVLLRRYCNWASRCVVTLQVCKLKSYFSCAGSTCSHSNVSPSVPRQAYVSTSGSPCQQCPCCSSLWACQPDLNLQTFALQNV